MGSLFGSHKESYLHKTYRFENWFEISTCTHSQSHSWGLVDDLQLNWCVIMRAYLTWT